MGNPLKFAIFLFGIRELPDRAGIIATLDIVGNIVRHYTKFKAVEIVNKSVKAVVVGLGQIGYLNNNNEYKLTHYANLLNHFEIKVRFGVDRLSENCAKFTSQTGIKALTSIDEIRENVDLVVIAVTNESHLQVLFQSIEKLNAKFIICEKPLGSNFLETSKIVDLCKTNGALLFVPYFRRYLPEMIEIKEIIENKIYGNISEVVISYGQGLVQNGCHFINLADFLLNGLIAQNIDLKGVQDSNNPSFDVKYPNFKMKVIGLDSIENRTGEIRILFEKGQVNIMSGGSLIIHGPSDSGSRWLTHSPSIRSYKWEKGMEEFYKAIMPTILNPEHYNWNDVNSAIRTREIMSKVLGE